jgi:hypothetical protein
LTGPVGVTGPGRVGFSEWISVTLLAEVFANIRCSAVTL